MDISVVSQLYIPNIIIYSKIKNSIVNVLIILSFHPEILNQSSSLLNLEKVVAGVFRSYREKREKQKKFANINAEDPSDRDQQLLNTGTKANPTSLTKACEFFLGKELNKTEQVSTWNVRPLSDTQVSWFFLLHVYMKLDHFIMQLISFSYPIPATDYLCLFGCTCSIRGTFVHPRYPT